MKKVGATEVRLGLAEQLTQQNVDTVRRLEEATKLDETFLHRMATLITRFCGSITFVGVHAIWYLAWIGINVGLPERFRFDAFPFSLLTLVVSLEAIFLSTFILIAQNRQSILSERRAHLDLQVNLLAEQENTKMLELLQKMAAKMGVFCHDEDTNALAEPMRPEHLATQIEQTIERGNDQRS